MRRTYKTLGICALMLMLLLVQGKAEEAITARDFVSQVMAPAAATDGPEWTQADCQALLRQAEDKGLLVTGQLLERFENPEGADKLELMRAVLQEEWGTFSTTWPLADQAWFDDLALQLGLVVNERALLPGEGDLSEAEARQLALDFIKERWLIQPEPADAARWQTHQQYLQSTPLPGVTERTWYLGFEGLKVELPEYYIVLNRDGSLRESQKVPSASEKDVQPMDVQDRYERVYGDFITWSYQTWQAFQRDLRAAIDRVGPEDFIGNIGIFLEQEYGQPQPHWIPEEEAVNIAIQLEQAPKQVDRLHSGAILLMDGEVPVWKVRLVEKNSPGTFSPPFLAEIDARDGRLRSIRPQVEGRYSYRHNYVLDRLVPAEDATEAPVSPTARPDGKPHFWYSSLAPAAFWQVMDELLAQGEISQLMESWRREYGDNQHFWPLPAQALMDAWQHPANLEGTIAGLPGAADISQEEALRIARQVLLDSGVEQSVIDGLKPSFSFNYNKTAPSSHEWVVIFWHTENQRLGIFESVSIDAENGQIIQVGGSG